MTHISTNEISDNSFIVKFNKQLNMPFSLHVPKYVVYTHILTLSIKKRKLGIISALGSQRQANICEIKASGGYFLKPCFKNPKQKIPPKQNKNKRLRNLNSQGTLRSYTSLKSSNYIKDIFSHAFKKIGILSLERTQRNRHTHALFMGI